MTLVSPSILSADFGRLASEIDSVSSADWIHVDVMDGRFVPNITIGPLVVEAARRATKLPLDVHLMIVEPERYIADFRAAGADWITVHAEASTHLDRTIQAIHELGAKAGVALNPHTPETVLDYVLETLDLVLVMSVNPGFGGQSLIERVFPKMEHSEARAQHDHRGGWRGQGQQRAALQGRGRGRARQRIGRVWRGGPGGGDRRHPRRLTGKGGRLKGLSARGVAQPG